MAMSWRYVEELEKNHPQIQWAKHLGAGNFSMAMRMDTKPFDDIRVRRALNMAINRKKLWRNFMEVTQKSTPILFPPTFKSVYTPLEKLPPSGQRNFQLQS
jgi:peptide/nickel transport system substrate-binding protein